MPALAQILQHARGLHGWQVRETHAEAQESGELDGVATLGVTMTLEVPAFELTHVIAGDVELG